MDATNTINTNGWDTIYAVPFSLVNESIANKSSSPTSFSKSAMSDDGNTSFSGTFGHWQLTPGGEGKFVLMSLPVPDATFVFGTKTETFKDIEVIIQTELAWIADPKNSNFQNLVMASNPKSPLQVIKINFKSNPGSVAEGTMKQMLVDWLAENASTFQHIFNTVNLNAVADTASFAWMMPTSVAYAVKDNLLGVLCMTEGRLAPGSAQLPAKAIPDGANSGFLISPERVVDKMFFPNIKDIFKDAHSTDFAITTTKLGIQNTKALHFTKQKMEDGTDKDIFIDAKNFTLELLADQLGLQFNNLYFDWNNDLSVHFNHHSTATLTFPKGVPNLKITGSNTDVNTEASDSYFIGEIAGSIAAALAGAILGGIVGGALAGGGEVVADVAADLADEGASNAIAMNVLNTSGQAATNIAPAVVADVAAGGGNIFTTFFAQGWAKVWGNIIGSILGGLVGGIPVGVMEILKLVAKGDTPDLTDFGSAMLQAVTWPDTSKAGFEVVDGALNGALQIGINWKTANA